MPITRLLYNALTSRSKKCLSGLQISAAKASQSKNRQIFVQMICRLVNQVKSVFSSEKIGPCQISGKIVLYLYTKF